MKRMLFILVMSLILGSAIAPFTSSATELPKANTIYVPIYKSFYHFYGSSRDTFSLTSTVYLHNTDQKIPIVINTIEYSDQNGKLINKLIDEPMTIKPWTIREITLQVGTQLEDSGSHLIIRWKADQTVNHPLVEVLMVGQAFNRGVSFLTRGYEIKE